MDTIKRAIFVAGLTATSVLAQCSAPEFFSSSQILAIGQRAFSVVTGGDGGCTDGGQSGNVFLVRPGDSSFSAIPMGFFDATSSTNPNNTILAPSVSNPGYGYRIIIGPDATSTPVALSPTFALVTADWQSQSFDGVALVFPNPQSDSTTWTSSGQQLIAYQAFENLGISSFTALLYNAEDVTQSPTTVTDSVPIPSIDQTTDEYFFQIQNSLPTGSNYQLVLVPSSGETDKVLSMSGLIQIQAGSGGPNPFPFTFTQVRTINGDAALPTATLIATVTSNSNASSAISTSASNTTSSSSTSTTTTSASSTPITIITDGTTLIITATAPPSPNAGLPSGSVGNNGTLPNGLSTSGAAPVSHSGGTTLALTLAVSQRWDDSRAHTRFFRCIVSSGLIANI
ncbi:hypothetical protein DACRYDRAFT_24766 [Dacryopinax primogenitus]|uniref:Uncharacterized protein n=1 Tax=Dacryopinax primogenitus (strain DJM 731) TaxID=1858805 RepID=M5FQK3_DACPD|nr:uncharacterized protein DACRYDRAFT_24766 [Dacryopinax primogenitus]EJT97788.1 hypothetical protein DACRYDRAFT_24766 [Dacryopinax primogenitus]